MTQSRPPPQPASIPPSDALGIQRWLTAVFLAGPVVFCIAAAAYGVLEVHSSTDTWIGLAAGKQIFESPTFPKTDTFSYTFHGSTWYNQNWLTHVWQYWLYRSFGPNAVIYGTWLMAASIFGLVLLAAHWKMGGWLAPTWAAGVVAFGCRDFLSARPATTGFFLMAAGLALICALEAPRRRYWREAQAGELPRERWWPIALMLPLLLIWGNAHGSFVFGYGMIGLYGLHWGVGWLVARFLGERNPCATGWLNITFRQAWVTGVVMIAAFLLTWWLGPFGFDNFTHVEKIRGSSVFRNVSEWKSPFEQAQFPPVWRLWLVLRIGAAALLIAAAIGGIGLAARRFTRWPAPAETDATEKTPSIIDKRSRKQARRDRAKLPESEREDIRRSPLHMWLRWMFGSLLLYDIVMIVIGWSLTKWARRFAPILFIFAAPAIESLFVSLVRPLDRRARAWFGLGLHTCGWILAVVVAKEAWKGVQKELIDDFKKTPAATLLERVTRYDATPHDCIMYLKHNDVRVNLLTEWTQAGPLMFYTPQVRLFMDGRAQQLYDEATYMDLQSVMNLRFGQIPQPERQRNADIVNRVLDSPSRVDVMGDAARTDAVLIRRTPNGSGLWQVLREDGDREWVLVDCGENGSYLFLRKESHAFRAIAARVLAGTEWRSDTGFTTAAKGSLLLAIRPEAPQAGLDSFMQAISKDILMGDFCFSRIVGILAGGNQVDAARAFIQRQRDRLAGEEGRRLAATDHDVLVRTLDQCERDLNRRLWGGAGSRPASAPGSQPLGAGETTGPHETADKKDAGGGH